MSGIVLPVIAGLSIGVLLIAILTLVFNSIGNATLSSSSSVPSIVFIRGSVGMVDGEKHAVLITFIDQATGQRYHESVNSAGLYSIGLPNGSYSYVVRIQWEAPDGSQGTCDSGTLSYVTQVDARDSFNTGC